MVNDALDLEFLDHLGLVFVTSQQIDIRVDFVATGEFNKVILNLDVELIENYYSK